jgi:hypothetical protein
LESGAGFVLYSVTQGAAIILAGGILSPNGNTLEIARRFSKQLYKGGGQEAAG